MGGRVLSDGAMAGRASSSTLRQVRGCRRAPRSPPIPPPSPAPGVGKDFRAIQATSKKFAPTRIGGLSCSRRMEGLRAAVARAAVLRDRLRGRAQDRPDLGPGYDAALLAMEQQHMRKDALRGKDIIDAAKTVQHLKDLISSGNKKKNLIKY